MEDYTCEDIRDKFRHQLSHKTNKELFQLFSKATAIYKQSRGKSKLAVALAAGWMLLIERDLTEDLLQKTGAIFAQLTKARKKFEKQKSNQL